MPVGASDGVKHRRIEHAEDHGDVTNDQEQRHKAGMDRHLAVQVTLAADHVEIDQRKAEQGYNAEQIKADETGV